MKPFIHYIKPLWFPAAIVSLLSLLTVAGTLYIPTLTATSINDDVLKGDLEMITRFSMNMLVMALLTVLSAILGVAMNARISASVGKVLRDDLVKVLQYFSLRDFTHFGTGTILMRTSIVIAHRLSTIKNADFLLVVEIGTIVEQGTHDELIERGGHYKQLYENYAAGMSV